MEYLPRRAMELPSRGGNPRTHFFLPVARGQRGSGARASTRQAERCTRRAGLSLAPPVRADVPVGFV